MFKIQISKSNLSAIASKLQGALAEKALSSVGLCAKDSQLELMATDHVLAVYSRNECTVEEEGTIFVPAKLFSETVRELPQDDILMEANEGFLKVYTTKKSSEVFSIKLPLIENMLWRNPPKKESFDIKMLPSSKIAYMVEQVQFCILADSPRVYGSVGFLHSPDKKSLRLVGTDGFRLSHCDILFSDDNLDALEVFSKGVCFSKRAIQEIYRVCQMGFENIHFGIDKEGKTALVEVENHRLFVRIVDIKYPNYNGVLPKKLDKNVDINRAEMQAVVRRVLLAADKSKALRFNFSNENIMLQSKTTGSSESKENLTLPGFSVKDSKIAVNGKYLSDILNTSAVENLSISFQEENLQDPLVFIPKQEPEGCRSKHLLVPIKETR